MVPKLGQVRDVLLDTLADAAVEVEIHLDVAYDCQIEVIDAFDIRVGVGIVDDQSLFGKGPRRDAAVQDDTRSAGLDHLATFAGQRHLVRSDNVSEEVHHRLGRFGIGVDGLAVGVVLSGTVAGPDGHVTRRDQRHVLSD